MDTKVLDLTTQAIGTAWEEWALLHPSLAATITTLQVTVRTVDRLRDRPDYKAAVEEYVQGRVEIDFMNKLAVIVGEVLPLVLAAI